MPANNSGQLDPASEPSRFSKIQEKYREIGYDVTPERGAKVVRITYRMSFANSLNAARSTPSKSNIKCPNRIMDVLEYLLTQQLWGKFSAFVKHGYNIRIDNQELSFQKTKINAEDRKIATLPIHEFEGNEAAWPERMLKALTDQFTHIRELEEKEYEVSIKYMLRENRRGRVNTSFYYCDWSVSSTNEKSEGLIFHDGRCSETDSFDLRLICECIPIVKECNLLSLLQEVHMQVAISVHPGTREGSWKFSDCSRTKTEENPFTGTMKHRHSNGLHKSVVFRQIVEFCTVLKCLDEKRKRPVIQTVTKGGKAIYTVRTGMNEEHQLDSFAKLKGRLKDLAAE